MMEESSEFYLAILGIHDLHMGREYQSNLIMVNSTSHKFLEKSFLKPETIYVARSHILFKMDRD